MGNKTPLLPIAMHEQSPAAHDMLLSPEPSALSTHPGRAIQPFGWLPEALSVRQGRWFIRP